MFYSLTGKIIYKDEQTVAISCGGVGFKCFTTRNSLAKLSLQSGEVTVFTHLNVREDALDLFGFSTESELQWFRMLISVNGVGPKAAMSILASGPQNFTLAVMTGDEKLLTAAQGVGKKIAQRIILELKEKIGGGAMELDFTAGPAAAAPVQQGSAALANAALQELGYSPAEIAQALKGVDPKASTEDMIRHALRAMVMKN